MHRKCYNNIITSVLSPLFLTQALKAEIDQLRASSALAVVAASPAAPPLAVDSSSEIQSKLASYQNFMASYIVNAQNQKLLGAFFLDECCCVPRFRLFMPVMKRDAVTSPMMNAPELTRKYIRVAFLPRSRRPTSPPPVFPDHSRFYSFDIILQHSLAAQPSRRLSSRRRRSSRNGWRSCYRPAV